MIVGLPGLWWRLRFMKAIRRHEPSYPLLSAWFWATASHEDALIENAECGEDVPTPEEALSAELAFAKDL